MILLYSLGIKLYVALLYLVSPFNEKAKLMLSGRKDWQQDLKKNIDPKAKHLWFHCSSLGEFEQGRPLIEAIKSSHPEYKILLSFFSPSGFEIRKNYEGADVVCYLPFDSKKNASFFIDLVKPEKVFFIKYEFWYFFLKGLNDRHIPSYLVSAIFRKNQSFFKWYGSWFLKILKSFTFLFVQDDDSRERLESYGIENVITAGDTRFDRVADVLKQKKSIPIVETFKGNTKIIIAGSSWPADEDLLCAFINKSSNDGKFIIAPHEVHESHIQDIQSKLNVPYLTYSKIQEGSSGVEESKVLIIDTIGILSSLYQYGDIAYIGGGFGVGIHNTLEAATYGLPVIFGPNYRKFREAVQLIDCGGAFSIADGDELNLILTELLTEQKKCLKSGDESRNYVIANTGASKQILENVFVSTSQAL